MSSRISFNTVLKRLLTIAALVAAFFVSAGLVIYFAYGGREVKVPELVGRTQEEARSELEGLGLRMRVTTSAPSDKVAADKVSEQDPRAGMTVKTGQSVRVIVSSGLVPAASSAAPNATAGSSPAPAASRTPRPRPKVTPDTKKSDDRQEGGGTGNKGAEKKPPGPAGSARPGNPGTERKDARPGN